MEFVVSNAIQVHPMALVHFDRLKDEKAKQEIARLTAGYTDKPDYFVDKLSHGLRRLCAAVYPKPAHHPHERFQDERICRSYRRKRL